MGLDGRLEDVTVGRCRMVGRLSLPDGCHALILLGYVGSMITPRTLAIKNILNAAGFGLLTLDFKGEAAPRTQSMVINVGYLAAGLLDAYDWIIGRADLAGLPRGVVIGGVGTAAALKIESMRPGRFGAIVSCGGRTDLVADEQLARVLSPTLLIVGGEDVQLERMNRHSLSRMRCIRRLEVLPNMHHEMDEPGALETAAHFAAQWFSRELRPRWARGSH